MSAYSEYKHGLITYEQYRAACEQEEWLDKYLEEKKYSMLDEDDEEEEEED